MRCISQREKAKALGCRWHLLRASFSDNGAKGLDDAHYVKAWEVQGDKIEWQAKSEQAEALARSEKLEADDRKRNELEELMLPIRKQYGALTKRRDRAGPQLLKKLS